VKKTRPIHQSTKDSRHILFPEKQLKRTPSGLSVVATEEKRKDANTTYPESALAHSEEMSRVKILVVEDLKAWIST
jgi:hypothetical protein